MHLYDITVIYVTYFKCITTYSSTITRQWAAKIPLRGEFYTQPKIYKPKNNVFNSIVVTALLRYLEMIGTPIKFFSYSYVTI